MFHLAGMQRELPRRGPLGEEGLAFYEEFFGRLGEINPGAVCVRILRFTEVISKEVERILLGVEVPDAAQLPDGMNGWSLTPDERVIFTMEDGRLKTRAQPIAWSWLANETTHPVGEFRCLREHGSTEVFLTAQAFTDPGREVEDGDRIRVVDYDPAWPKLFRRYSDEIQSILGDMAGRIEHYGSTAIPGMAAKPIVDLLIEIPDVARAKRRLLTALTGPEWEYWWNDGHLFWLRRDGFMGRRLCHLHLAPQGYPLWGRLAFRDYLRAHADEARQYADLKRRLAEEYGPDRERYTLAKGEFIREIMAKARQSR